MASRRKQSLFSEILGLVLLGAGALLFLALLTYDPKDLPSWLFFAHHTPPNKVPANLIGIVGAISAGLCLFLFGGASYLLAMALVGYGATLFVSPGFRVLERAAWLVPLLITGASLLQLQPWFLADWRHEFNIDGPGGWFGYWVGQKAFVSALSPIGSAILLSALYLASAILATGFHPIRTIKQAASSLSAWLAERERRRQEKLSEADRLVEEQAKVEKAARKLERASRKKKEATADEQPAAAPQNLPEPKIIDASLPAPARKPTASELEAKRGKKSEDALGSLAEVRLENYTLPSIDLLDPHEQEGREPTDPAELRDLQTTIIETLRQFGIETSPGDITKGPTLTRYELYPARGVRVDKIVSLERDIARSTRAERINILAPIPGKDTVGIEIANRKKVKVTLRELLESEDWAQSKARLPFAVGKDVYGKTIIADLASMPHGLIAGTTGSGKSVCVNAMIASLLNRFTPTELRFIMIDPKVVEMQIYNKLPHLVCPVVTQPKKVVKALDWVVYEMETRYRIFAEVGVRNITSFNARPKPKSQAELDAEKCGEEEEKEENPPEQAALPMAVPRDDELEIPERMPYIVVIVDELADLMQTAPAEVEGRIARITQMARAAGIHMIVATQTPRADVVTGVIKANIPSRIAFQVASKIDSRVILDENGAERLLGQGDMLYLPPGTSKLVRAQGVLVTDDEIRRLVDFVGSQTEPQFDATISQKLESGSEDAEDEITAEEEDLMERCLEVIRQTSRASTSLLQRRLKLGYNRAARMMDLLESRGYVGPADGNRDREILFDVSSA